MIQFIARPLNVALSTFGSGLTWRERALLAWIAPRGIVAAAVSAIFALRMQEHGAAQAQLLVPLTFLVIIGTVVLQSATARPLARLLKVAEPAAYGFLIIGANPVARAIGKALQQRGSKILLTDSIWENIRAARMDNLPTYFGNPASQHADANLDLTGIGQLLALSPSSEQNSMACTCFRPDFGKKNLYSLTNPREQRLSEKHRASHEYRGLPFGYPTQTYGQLAGLLARAAEVHSTTLTGSFGWHEYQALHGCRANLLLAIDPRGRIHVASDPLNLIPAAGWTLVALIEEAPEAEPQP